MHLVRIVCVAMACFIFSEPSLSAPIDAQTINDAQWTENKVQGSLNPVIVKLQILLDRANFSPGEIDGKLGENVEKAIAGFATAQGASGGSGMSADLWRSLSEMFSDPVIIEHTISEANIKGPFADIPDKMEDMKNLDSLPYSSIQEKLGEKFHMSPELLVALNPDSKFDKAGEKIFVANVLDGKLPDKVTRIEIDKTMQTMRVFGKLEKLLAMYPITAGSKEKPAPDGTLKVTSIVKNPTYHYNPDYEFKGVKSREPFTIKPGPNNPVGSIWIGLDKEGYGIHGAPEPSKVSKSESHGCIRMTNWDALKVAAALQKGIPVEFIGDESEQRASTRQRKRR